MSNSVINFSSHDRITLLGKKYHFIRRNGHDYELGRLDKEGLTERFTSEQLHDWSKRQDYRIEYGFFEQKLDTETAKGSYKLCFQELSEKEQIRLLFKEAWVRAMLARNARHLLKLTEGSIKQARKDLSSDVKEALWGYASGRTDKAMEVFPDPSARTALRWYKRLKEAQFDVMSLQDLRGNSGNHEPKLELPVYDLMSKAAELFKDRNQPSKTHCYDKLKRMVIAANQTRLAQGLEELDCPSFSRFCEEINALDAFEVCAAREGLAYAEKLFFFVGEGIQVTRLGERVEVDEWRVDLFTFVRKLGLLEKLSKAAKKAAKKVRVLVCAAIDVASRVIVGLKIGLQATSNLAIDTLKEVVSDKSALAAAYGAETQEEYRVMPETVVTDAGSALISAETRGLIVALNATQRVPRTGYPQGRPFIERLFRTIGCSLLPYFSGRTFSNINQKGDYDPEDRTTLHIEELEYAIQRWRFDIYHNKRHAGLNGRTPRNAWRHIESQVGKLPDIDKHQERRIFGLAQSRKVGAKGLCFLGIQYQSDELQKLRRKNKDVWIKFRVDPDDLGVITAQVGDSWIDISSTVQRFGNYDLQTWLGFLESRREQFKAEEKQSELVVFRALDDLSKMSDHAARRAEHESSEAILRKIRIAEKKMPRGFALRPLAPEACAEAESETAQANKLLGNEIAPAKAKHSSSSTKGGGKKSGKGDVPQNYRFTK